MSPPDVPGAPGFKLPPRIREEVVVQTPVPPPRSKQASQEAVEFKGSGFSLSLPNVVVMAFITAVGAFVGRSTAPAAVPPDDSLRLDVREFAVNQRAKDAQDRERDAKIAQQETLINQLRIEVAGMRSDITTANTQLARLLEELKKK